MSARIDLSGRSAIVTGAGRGLGRAYAVALAAAGAAVVVNDMDADAADETVELVKGGGGRATAIAAAVGDAEVADALVAIAVEEFGRLDVLVTNAGVLRDGVLWKMSDENFDLVTRTHLRGTFTCARAAAVRFREQGDGGRIVVVGSPAGQYGNFGQTNYAAAKAGIAAMARTWAMELARAEVTVNAIIPTAWTQMTATIPIYAPLVEAVDAGEPLPRQVRQAHAIGTPEDSAALVVFLASDASAAITGQAIGIGGDKLSLYSHPAEVVAAFHDGGWTPELIAENWSTTMAPMTQQYGITLPELDLPDGRTAGVMSIDLDVIDAIDVHTHAQVPRSEEPDPITTGILDAAAKHFRSDFPRPNAADVAIYYRERRMAAVIFCVDNEANTGEVPVSNDEVLDVAAANPDVLIPFVSLDPHRGKRAVSEARRLIDKGARGFKFHPNLQGFFPNDRLAYELYAVIEEAQLPALFHTGHSGMGSGLPGGGGIRLKYSNPMYVDDVAVDFPEMPIVLAHPSFPWQEEAISVAMHKAQVYIDLSGWSPKLFPPVLVQYANTVLQDKVLFGSDYPVITPERWLRDLEKTEIKPELHPKILKDNAARLLGLA